MCETWWPKGTAQRGVASYSLSEGGSAALLQLLALRHVEETRGTWNVAEMPWAEAAAAAARRAAGQPRRGGRPRLHFLACALSTEQCSRGYCSLCFRPEASSDQQISRVDGSTVRPHGECHMTCRRLLPTCDVDSGHLQLTPLPATISSLPHFAKTNSMHIARCNVIDAF